MTQSVSAGRSYCSPGAFGAHICHFIARKATTRLSSARSRDAPKRPRPGPKPPPRWVSGADGSDSQATISPWEALRGHLRINNYHRGFKLKAVSANISELKASGRSTTRCLMGPFPHWKGCHNWSRHQKIISTRFHRSDLSDLRVLQRFDLLCFSFKDH